MAIIVNADDLGISPGCNAATAECCAKGGINSLSFLANGEYLDDALKKTEFISDVDFGVHLTLSYGRSLSGKNSLAPDGVFNKSYPELIFRSIFSSVFRSEVELEFECQIRHLIAKGLRLSHIDSHRHVHMIPAIFKITAKLAEKYGIERIRRSCDEGFFFSLRRHGWPWKLTLSGIAKFALMRIFGLFIGKRKSDRLRFVSMLYSGTVNEALLNNVLDLGKDAEIALHPGFPEMDVDASFHGDLEERYWLSIDRTMEKETCSKVFLSRL